MWAVKKITASCQAFSATTAAYLAGALAAGSRSSAPVLPLTHLNVVFGVRGSFVRGNWGHSAFQPSGSICIQTTFADHRLDALRVKHSIRIMHWNRLPALVCLLLSCSMCNSHVFDIASCPSLTFLHDRYSIYFPRAITTFLQVKSHILEISLISILTKQ